MAISFFFRTALGVILQACTAPKESQQPAQQPSTRALDLTATEVLPTPHVSDPMNFTFHFHHCIIKNSQILPTQLSDTQAGFAQSGEITI